MARTNKSGLVLVKVAKTGGIVTEVALNGDHTVEDALSAAGIDYSEDEERVRVNGKAASLSTNLKNGDVVTLSGSIKGGSK